MSGSILTQNIPQPTLPIFNTDTGIMEPIWYRFFLSLFSRTGGSNPSGATGVPGGLDTNVQYNSAGTFGGLTNIQLTTRIQRFSSTLSGAVPASAGGTSNFLRADGTFTAPAGTTYTNGTGLSLTGATFALITPVAVANGGTGSGTSTGSGSVVLATAPTFSGKTSAGASVGGATNAPSRFLVSDSAVLGDGAAAYLYPAEMQTSVTSNTIRLQEAAYRRTAGTGWQGAGFRFQYAVDGTFTDGSKVFVELGATGAGNGQAVIGIAGTDRLTVGTTGIEVAGAVLTDGVAFASLPTAVAGMHGYVTDSTTNVWGATIAGGGANKVLAFYNGTNWTVAGK